MGHSFDFRFMFEAEPTLEINTFPRCPLHLWDEYSERFLSGNDYHFIGIMDFAVESLDGKTAWFTLLCGLEKPHHLDQLGPWASFPYRRNDGFTRRVFGAKDDLPTLERLGAMIRDNSSKHGDLPLSPWVVQGTSMDTSKITLPHLRDKYQPGSGETSVEAKVAVDTRVGSHGPEHTVVVMLTVQDQKTQAQEPSKL